MAPCSNFQTLGLQPSFGFGDRLGCGTPGHVRAMQHAGGNIRPVFAQQSIREMQRTGRTPVQVLADARSGIEQAGWRGIHGADADHLKTLEHVDVTAAAGFTFFTIDPSDHVDQQADTYTVAELKERFKAARQVAPWFEQYLDRAVVLSTGSTIVFDEVSCMRAVVKYGAALQHALTVAERIEAVRAAHGREYEVELSVDETPQPTTLAEHYIMADQLIRSGVRLVSVAPRFPGEFEKGVDFRGDEREIEHALADHAAIAKQLGPYKLSLHSGSDKLSIYGSLAKATEGRFHVKTAGTSYLEAIRVVAHHDAALFREIVAFSRSRYEADRATYHVSAQLNALPDPSSQVTVHELEQIYLGIWDDVPAGQGFRNLGRQVLHCTFGSVLTDLNFGARLRKLLLKHADAYTEILTVHFVRHLEALQLDGAPAVPQSN